MKSIVLFTAIILVAGCESDDTRISSMADDYCACFSDINDSVSIETVASHQRFFNTDSIDHYQEQLNTLDSAQAKKMHAEMIKLGEWLTRKPEMINCFTSLAGKYGTFFDGQGRLKNSDELAELLETRNECRVAVLYLRMMDKIKLADDISQ